MLSCVKMQLQIYMAASAMCMLLQIHGEATCTTEVCRSNHQKELQGISTLQKRGQPEKLLGTSVKEVDKEAAQNSLAQITVENQSNYQVQTGARSTPTNQVTMNSTSNGVAMVVSSSEAAVSIDPASVPEFVAGVVEGFVHKNDLTEIEGCLTNAKTLEGEIKVIVQDLSTHGVSQIEDAVMKIVTLVQQIPDALKNCKGIHGDIQKIKTWAQNIDTSKIPFHVIEHHTVIMNDVETITTDFKNNKYFDAGEQVAAIAIEVLGALPTPAPTPQPGAHSRRRRWWR